MFDYPAIIIKPKNINACPIAVTGPLLMAMQTNIIPFGDNALEMDALTGIVLRHPLKIFDKSLLTIGNCGVMLDIDIADIFLDSFGWLTLIEH
jgi:hypothetical protein